MVAEKRRAGIRFCCCPARLPSRAWHTSRPWCRRSEADFTRQQSSQSEFAGYDVIGLNVSNNNGRVSGSTTIRFTPAVGTNVTQSFPMVKEDGEWRICE
ncbi:hypothetical protein [Micromonospora tulbaghiae]|uniref:hypothetical protein n=1 Tax=Micromonospora tulbaghiae TaxID=479978 RepID=UPI0036A79EDC